MIAFSLVDLVVLGALLFFGVSIYFFSWLGSDPAPNNPRAYKALRDEAEGGEPPPRRPLAVCAGDSITRGSYSADYVAMLASRLSDWDFVNAGVNAELAYNLAERIGDIVALDPDAVTILIGTNDVNATFGLQAALGYMTAKRLPERPGPLFFRENLLGIVRTLKRETRARIALFSLPPIGEESGHYAYLRTEDYSAIIREIAEGEGVEYLPLRERICGYIESLPRGRERPLPFREFGRAQFRAGRMRSFLGKSLDEVSAFNRFHILVDGIHLNTHGASIVAELAEGFLKSVEARESVRGALPRH
jgi:acyl-CoA thioesterase I